MLNVKIFRANLQISKLRLNFFSFVLTIFPLKTINPVLLATISLALCYFVVFPEVS